MLLWEEKRRRQRRRRTHRDSRWVKIYVVNPAAGKVSPAGRQPLFDGLEGDIEVNDRVCAVGVLQSFCLRHRPRETWWANVAKPLYLSVQCRPHREPSTLRDASTSQFNNTTPAVLFYIPCRLGASSFQHSILLLFCCRCGSLAVWLFCSSSALSSACFAEENLCLHSSAQRMRPLSITSPQSIQLSFIYTASVTIKLSLGAAVCTVCRCGWILLNSHSSNQLPAHNKVCHQ